MMHLISEAITNWLEQEGVVSSKEYELYAYAAYSFLFGILPIIIVFLLGLCFGMIQEGIVLILPFMLLRKFCGGYHLNSLVACIIFSTILLTVALGAVKVITFLGATSLLTVLVFLCVIILFVFSPVENNARKLSENEKRVFRKISRALACATLSIYLLSKIALSERYTVPIGVGIILVAFLMIPCIPAKIISFTREMSKHY